MTAGGWDLGDVLVRIEISAAVGWIPLASWMASGPGPRHFTRPDSAKSRSTGGALPLTVIPLAYRNDRESRALIAAGRIASPWRDVPWDIDQWGEPPCEVRGPRPFDRSVAQPQQLDRLAAGVVRMLPPGLVDAQAARVVLAEIPEFGGAAGVLVRRLAAQARWEQLDAVVDLAAVAGLVDVAAVLCEVLESDARPPHPGHLVDALGQLKYDAAARLLVSLIGQYVYADRDLGSAQRCLRALAAIDKQDSRTQLLFIHSNDWPEPLQQWAAQELEANGQHIPPPGR